jgi:hypothetical protein
MRILSARTPRGETRYVRNCITACLFGMTLSCGLAADTLILKRTVPLTTATSAAIPYVYSYSTNLDLFGFDAGPGETALVVPAGMPPASGLPIPDDPGGVMSAPPTGAFPAPALPMPADVLHAAVMPKVVPPLCPPRSVAPLTADIGPKLVEFETSPFPYHGKIPGENKPFMDTVTGDRYGHTSPRGSLHWEDQNYNDRHVLLYVPRHFDLSRPALMVVFFHGNHAQLKRDVYARQRVPQQLAGTNLNAVLVAPQFGFDVADASAGGFWIPGTFNRFLAEAARHLSALYRDPCAQTVFDAMEVILVAYSGGYNPAAYALDVGGANMRVYGVVLLDALYAETEKFERWITWIHQRGSGFFFSAYSESSRAENLKLWRSVEAQSIQVRSPNPLRLTNGSVTFLATDTGVRHNDFVTQAWVRDPLKAVLSGIEGFRTYAAIDEFALPPRTGASGGSHATVRSTYGKSVSGAQPALIRRGAGAPEH